MPGFPGDRIKVFSVTTGTGTTLATNGPAVSSLFCSVAEAGLINGVEYHYIIEQGGDFEHSFGIYNAAGFIGRNVVASKINGVYSATAKLNLGGAQVVYFPYLKAVMTPPPVNFDPVEWRTASGLIIVRAPKCKVLLLGGGAGGGGGVGELYGESYNNASGGGGGAGATLYKLLTGLTPGNTLNLTIGANGVGGGAAANGTSGGATVLASGNQSITTLTSGGGALGIGGTSGGLGAQFVGADGAGGVATNGDLNIVGQPGYNSNGGSSAYGFGGAAAAGSAGKENGLPGIGYGSGGGGGVHNGWGGGALGAAGTPGFAVFEWYQ